MTDRIRLTITVPVDTHAVFQRMADVSGQSLGRVMGDWLTDTAEGAQMVAIKLQEARQAPKLVMRELRAMAVGMVDEVDAEIDRQRHEGWPAGRAEGAASPPPAGRRTSHTAPSSNTGLKSPPLADAKKAKRG